MKQIREIESVNGDVPEEPSLINWAQNQIFRTDKLFRLALTMLIVLLAFTLVSILWQFVSSFAGLLLLFTSAWLVALLLTPMVRVMVSMSVPKMVAVILSYVIVFAFMGGFIVLVLPGLINQTNDLITGLNGIANEIQRNSNDWLKTVGLSEIRVNDYIGALQSFGTDVLKNALSTVTGLAGFLLQILLVCIISFSLLAGRSYDRNDPFSKRQSKFWDKLPPSWREFYVRLLQSLERNFGVFLGGQLTVAVVYGIVVGLLMSITGFEYSVTTACVCGLLMVIPFFGGPLSLLPPLLVGIGSKTGGPIILVLIVLFIVQTALLNVVLPKLVGREAGIGPVLTLFVLLAGAQVGGIWGVLLAVPLAGVVKSMVDYLLIKLKTSDEVAQTTSTQAKFKPKITPTNTQNLTSARPVPEPTSQVEIAIEALVKPIED